MNLAVYANVKNISKINELAEIAKSNDTLCNIASKLSGVNASEAYHVLMTLSDHELKVIAAMIGEINGKFSK